MISARPELPYLTRAAAESVHRQPMMVDDYILSLLQPIMSSKPKTFRPNKFLMQAHLQTIGGYLFSGRMPKYTATKRTVDLFDGDQLVIHDDRPENWCEGDRIVILLHGFCGSHHSPYNRRLAHKLEQRNVRTIRIDFRGFGDSTFVSKSHLYGGCSHDVESVVQYVHELSPASDISLVGFSIGGNILMKLLGEWGANHPEYVDTAVTVSPPVDLVYASWNLRRMGNRIYEANFVSTLKQTMSQRRRKVPGLLDTGMKPLPNRLMQWDDQLTAPIWGFDSANDYYEKSGSGPLLGQVQVPTLMLWAKDDPIVPIDSYQRFGLSNRIEILETDHGGHLGFVGRCGDEDGDRYWMDWRILEWLGSQWLTKKETQTSRLIVDRDELARLAIAEAC